MRAGWLLGLAMGCEDVSGPPDQTFTAEGYSERIVDLPTVNSGTRAKAAFTVEVREGETGFTLFAESDDLISIEQVRSPNGDVVTRWQDWWYIPNDLMDAFYPSYKDMVFTWPMRIEDGPIAAGDWTVEVATANANWDYKENVNVWGNVRIRADEVDDVGTIRVALVFAEGVEDEPGVREAVDGAIDRWREVWDPVGLTLSLREVSSGFDPDLEPPWDPATDTAGAAALAEDGEVVVFLGETLNGNLGWYGVSGGIPGPLDITDRSATLVSWLAHAGGNAVFNADEIGLMGETLAHEVGHYVGLGHPVQSDYDRWDAIEDTPECDSANSCDAALGENIMFPYSICDATGCLDTFRLTDDQVGQLHRAGATR